MGIHDHAAPCRHCGALRSAHGTRGWCDSRTTGLPPGTLRYAAEAVADERAVLVSFTIGAADDADRGHVWVVKAGGGYYVVRSWAGPDPRKVADAILSDPFATFDDALDVALDRIGYRPLIVRQAEAEVAAVRRRRPQRAPWEA